MNFTATDSKCGCNNCIVYCNTGQDTAATSTATQHYCSHMLLQHNTTAATCTATQNNTTQHNSTQHLLQHNTTSTATQDLLQHNTTSTATQHNTTQHNTRQHNTTHLNTPQRNIYCNTTQDPAVRPPEHFTQDDYLEMGRLLCEAILDMYDPGRARLESALNELELVHPDIKRSNTAEDILSLGVHVCDTNSCVCVI